ncbi:MAG: hypothetical protein ABI488_16170 [Polyangiaceae bacterium]
MDNDSRLVGRMVDNWAALSELYVSNARIALAKPQPFEPWEQYALACLARAHYTIETIFRIKDREADIVALTRVLYEHAATFAWLMVDPVAHYARALAYEREERDKLGKGLGQHHPQWNLPEAAKLATLALGDDPTAKSVDLFARAERADRHWMANVTGWEFTFARNYQSIFRGYGTSVHATIAGLEPFFDPGLGTDPANPASRHTGQIPAEAMTMLVDMLVIAGESMVGWPSKARIIGVAFEGVDQLQREIERERQLEAIDSVKNEVLASAAKLGPPAALLALVRRDGDIAKVEIISRVDAGERFKNDAQVTEFLSRPPAGNTLTFLVTDAQSNAVTMGNLMVAEPAPDGAPWGSVAPTLINAGSADPAQSLCLSGDQRR